MDGVGAGAVVRSDVDATSPFGVSVIDVVRLGFATDDGESALGAVWEKISGNGALVGDVTNSSLVV